MAFRTLAAAAFASLSLAGCATTPGTLQGDYASISPRQAADAQDVGANVRWGGRIVQVEPRDDSTCFEVMSSRLDSAGRPAWGTDDDGGRFIACSHGYYDPDVFGVNRELTFTGRIDSYETRHLDGHAYQFPRLAADDVHLWPDRSQANAITRPAPWPWWGSW